MKKNIRITEVELISLIKQTLREDPVAEPTTGDFEGEGEGDKITTQPDDNIKCIQRGLITAKLGQMLGKYGENKDGVDGLYGELTRKAVKEFQKRNGIKQTGFVGNLTAPKLGCQPMTSKSKVSTKTTNKTTTTSPEKIRKKAAEKIEKIYDNDVPSNKITEEPDASLVFDGNYLYWVSNGQKVKKWDAKSGRSDTPANLSPEQARYFQGFSKKPEHSKLSTKEFSKIQDEGPLPEGKYYVYTIQKRNGESAEKLMNAITNIWDLYKLRYETSDQTHDWGSGTIQDKIAWGDHRLPITPEKGTNTYGRGGFYIHGGGILGSIGCIDLARGMEDFAKYFTTWKAKTKQGKLPLQVSYK